MRYSVVFTALAATTVSGHGLIRSIEGANGVSMPGLTGEKIIPLLFGLLSAILTSFPSC